VSEGSEIMQSRVTIATNCTAFYMNVRYVPGHERAVFIFSNKEWLSLESIHNEYDINTSGLQLILTSRSVVNRIPPNLTTAILMTLSCLSFLVLFKEP
jgi:hypothetical protein